MRNPQFNVSGKRPMVVGSILGENALLWHNEQLYLLEHYVLSNLRTSTCRDHMLWCTPWEDIDDIYIYICWLYKRVPKSVTLVKFSLYIYIYIIYMYAIYNVIYQYICIYVSCTRVVSKQINAQWKLTIKRALCLQHHMGVKGRQITVNWSVCSTACPTPTQT